MLVYRGNERELTKNMKLNTNKRILMHLAPPSTAMIGCLKVKNTHLHGTMYYELLLHTVFCLVILVMKYYKLIMIIIIII